MIMALKEIIFILVVIENNENYDEHYTFMTVIKKKKKSNWLRCSPRKNLLCFNLNNKSSMIWSYWNFWLIKRNVTAIWEIKSPKRNKKKKKTPKNRCERKLIILVQREEEEEDLEKGTWEKYDNTLHSPDLNYLTR